MMERCAKPRPGRSDETKDDHSQKCISQKTGCSFHSNSAHSSSFMLLWILGAFTWIGCLPTLCERYWGLRVSSGSGPASYRHQQSNLIILHPSVTLIRTETDAHFFIYIYYDDYVQALHLSHWWKCGIISILGFHWVISFWSSSPRAKMCYIC